MLVVGSGNSAAEIALDLVEGGAREVSMWVRGPRHFLPLSRVALAVPAVRLLGQFTPAKIAAVTRVSFGTPEFERIIAERDKVLSRLLGRPLALRHPQARRRPVRARPSCGAASPPSTSARSAKIRSGAIRVIDGNVRPIDGFEEQASASATAPSASTR